MNSDKYYIGIGKRKEATARVYLRRGEGKIQIRSNKINKKKIDIQNSIFKLEKSISNLEIALEKASGDIKIIQGLEVTKFEMEEELIELRKLKKENKEKKNAKELEDYFYMQPSLCEEIYRPLKLFNKEKDYDLIIRVRGSGFHSQAEAIRLGVARALLKAFPEYKTALESFSLLKRDLRKIERKKPGLKKARKRSQFAKR